MGGGRLNVETAHARLPGLRQSLATSGLYPPRVVGDRACIADARVQLAQIDFVVFDLDPEFAANLFGFFVEHQKDRRRSATAPEDLVHNILVLQQVVVDIFDRTELGMLLS